MPIMTTRTACRCCAGSECCCGGGGGTTNGAAPRRGGRASFAIGIFEAGGRNRGLGTEMTRLVLGYAFEVMKLHRVSLRVLAYNHRAIASYEKCGFVREGVE